MRSSLSDLLESGRVLLADGATGTNYFEMGLSSGEPPEFWNVDHPDRVVGLHRRFIEAGADIILTNSFGGTAQRLKLHNAQDRVFELAQLAAQLGRQAADEVDRPVIVAGSVGPTGELFEPLGLLTDEVAVASFGEQIRGLKAGGADVAWIETMSSPEEVRAAAKAAIANDMPYVATCSFDTAGRTMMGLMPADYPAVFADLPVPPVAIGANCGVGASDILVTVLSITESGCTHPVVSKGNCGVPQFQGLDIVYSGTPELMGRYAALAADSGARIVGGCCGTSPEHLGVMRHALDAWSAGARPTIDVIIEQIGPLANSAPTASGEGRERRRPRH
jgi:5-methyltetrahydrofolate--homocysteine methyltransferase